MKHFELKKICILKLFVTFSSKMFLCKDLCLIAFSNFHFEILRKKLERKFLYPTTFLKEKTQKGAALAFALSAILHSYAFNGVRGAITTGIKCDCMITLVLVSRHFVVS